ncbi:MAG: SurA N-terminal domain-containing protein [Thermodesulfobacteriota bacterium]
MLSWVRKYSRSWFVALAIGAIAIVFIFWGVGGFKSGRFQEVASVNGTPILLSTFIRQYNETLKEYQERTQGELSEEAVKKLHLKEQTLNRLIDEVLVQQGARRAEITVSTPELQEWIRRQPYFQEDGQFSERRYLGLLARIRLSPAQFEEQERQSLLLQKFIQSLTAFAKVSDGELQEYFRLAREKVAVQYLALPVESFLARQHPGDAEIAAYYQEHPGEFHLPERVKVRYILFRPQDFLAKAEVSPQEVEEYLKDHEKELGRPLTIRVREIFLALPPKPSFKARRQLEEKAWNLLQQVKGGADFAELVQKFSQDEASRKQGGDRGDIRRGQNPGTWDKVAFALSPGEVGLAVTPKGFHLIKLEEVKEYDLAVGKKGQALATRKLREEKARRLAREAAQQARGEMAAAPFGEVAKKFGLTPKETPLFTLATPLPDLGKSQLFQETAFGLQPQEISRVVELPAGFALLQCLEHLPAAEPPLEEVQDRVRQAVARQMARKQAGEEAAKLLQRLKQGEPLSRVAAQAALPLHTSSLFTRGQGFLHQPQAEPLTSAAFQLSAQHPYPPKPISWQNKYYLLAFKSRQAPSPEEFQKEQEKLRGEVLQYKRQLIFDAWLAGERQRAKIKIYEIPS